MSHNHKRLTSTWRAVLVIVAAFLMASFATAFDQKPQAVYAQQTDLSLLCVPPHDDETKIPGNWLRVEFVNRAVIRVTASGGGNCVTPSGMSASYIIDPTTFSDVINGELLDSNTDDNNYNYRFPDPGGGGNGDESVIRGFSGSLGNLTNSGNGFSGRDAIVSRSELQNSMRDIEYIIGIEEDRIPNAECSGTNWNFMLYDSPDDGDPMRWVCRNNDIPGNARGFRIGTIITNIDKFNITYAVEGSAESTVIRHVSGRRAFTWCPSYEQFRTENCQGDLYITSSINDISNIGAGTADIQVRRLNSSDTLTVRIAGPENTDGITTDTTNLGGLEEEDNSCESTSGVLGWIMCPIAGVLDSVAGFLDGQIQSLLTIDERSVFEGSSGEGLKAVWSQIRNIAYVILVPIMLVMVIGTALGFEVFSAYTIKKALPRMIIAVIFITLSWYICLFLIEFTNVLGSGIKGLVTSPFNSIAWASGQGEGTPSGLKAALNVAGISSSGDQGAWQGLGEGVTTAAALGIAATGIYFAGGLTLTAMISTLATAALVLGTVFLILIARQMFILAALLVAPLAILAWIFPGNDKLWKLWWSMFSKLLMMFPLIMLIIGVGEVFALVTANARIGDNRLITGIMVIAAVIIPYALIPFTFKWAGGVFGNLAGMVNDRERGVFDRLKKGRAESRAATREGHDNSAGLTGRIKRRAKNPMSVVPGRFGANARGRMATATTGGAGNAAKTLQAEGLLDNEANDEFIQHGRSASAFQARIKELKANGNDAMATKLAAYGHHVGRRDSILGAMKINAGFGKLSDKSLESLDDVFGESASDKAAKQAVFGDLIFASKQAGNYVTYAADMGSDGKIKTYAQQLTADPVAARTRLAKKLADGGPNVVGNLKPYKDAATGIDSKSEAIKALGVLAGTGDQGAMEQLASVAHESSYTDPTTRAAARSAAAELPGYTDTGSSRQAPVADGGDSIIQATIDVGGGRYVIQDSPAHRYEQIRGRVRPPSQSEIDSGAPEPPATPET